MRNNIKLEICATSVESIVAAKNGGADRIELCNNFHEGGTTPPMSWIDYAVNTANIKTFVLIRPRGGDFLYSDREFEIMKKDILHCASLKCTGVVLGILTKEGKVDKKRCNELIALSKHHNMQVTFHRAIDRTENILDAMECIIDLGCDKILTSGGYNTAIEGRNIIRQMVDQADDRIVIMPGSGVNENNIRSLADYTNAKEFHGSFRIPTPSVMKFSKKIFGDGDITYISSVEKIKRAVANLNNL